MQKWLIVLLAFGVYLLSLGSIWAYLEYTQSNPLQNLVATPTPTLDPNFKEVLPSPMTIKTEAKIWSLLFLGYGGAGHQGGFLTDVMQQVIILPEQKMVATIHIPRDIVVEYPLNSGQYKKINALFATKTNTADYPKDKVDSNSASSGAELAMAYVGMVTGVTPNAYMGIDFWSFVKAVDSLGGIAVQVKTPFTDPWYPVRGRELELCDWSPEQVTAMSATMSGFTLEKQFPCRYETLTFKAGLNLMKGDTALKYVRSRHSSSDFARGERQAAVLAAMLQKLVDQVGSSRFETTIKTLKSTVNTNILNSLETDLLSSLPSLSTFTQKTIVIDTNNGLKTSNKAGGSGLGPNSSDGSWNVIHDRVLREIGVSP